MANYTVIREYWNEDLSAVVRIWTDASAVGHPFLTEEYLESERQSLVERYLPVVETWVWEDGGRVGGFLSLMDDDVGGLFVDPLLHRRGIGRALVEHARDLRGELHVEVFKDNAPARAFYEACGFVEVQERVHDETGLVMLRLHRPSTSRRAEGGVPSHDG